MCCLLRWEGGREGKRERGGREGEKERGREGGRKKASQTMDASDGRLKPLSVK